MTSLEFAPNQKPNHSLKGNSAVELGFDREQIGTKLIFVPIALQFVLSILEKIAQNRITGTQGYGP